MVADSLSLVAVLSLLAPNGSAVISMVHPSPYLVDIFVVVPVATAYVPGGGSRFGAGHTGGFFAGAVTKFGGIFHGGDRKVSFARFGVFAC